MSAPKISVLIVSWNSRELTQRCIDSLLHLDWPCSYEIIVVDNASTDGTAEWLRTAPITTILNSTNTGYALANNQAYEKSTGDYLLILNSDAVLTRAALTDMLSWLEAHPNYGAGTNALLNSDGSKQYYMHRRFPTAISLLGALLYKRWPVLLPGFVKRYLYLDQTWDKDFDIEQAAGACILIRRSVIQEQGYLFDGEHFPLYYNDVDLCKRLHERNYKIRCLTAHPIRHEKGVSVRKLSLGATAREYSFGSLWYFRKHQAWFSYYLLKIMYIVLFTVIGKWSLVKQAITLRPAPGLLGRSDTPASNPQ